MSSVFLQAAVVFQLADACLPLEVAIAGSLCHSKLLLVVARNKPISEDRRMHECNAVQSGRKYLCFGASAASNFRVFYREVEVVGQHSWTPRRTDRPTPQSYWDSDFVKRGWNLQSHLTLSLALMLSFLKSCLFCTRYELIFCIRCISPTWLEICDGQTGAGTGVSVVLEFLLVGMIRQCSVLAFLLKLLFSEGQADGAGWPAGKALLCGLPRKHRTVQFFKYAWFGASPRCKWDLLCFEITRRVQW